MLPIALEWCASCVNFPAMYRHLRLWVLGLSAAAAVHAAVIEGRVTAVDAAAQTYRLELLHTSAVGLAEGEVRDSRGARRCRY